MPWRWGRRAQCAPAYRCNRLLLLPAGLCAFALAACVDNGPAQVSVAQPRGATVAFDSIDGPPPAQFQQLVQDLNDEAQSRRLAVTSREASAAYRVRGYLAAEAAKGQSTITWVWDVFDTEQHRSLRISGAETVKGRHADAWQVADDALLRRIAQNSISELAAFLTSAEVAPGTPDIAPAMALLGPDSSPEAAGIFRIFHSNADSAPTPVMQVEPAAADRTVAVPLPRRRPAPATALSARAVLPVMSANRL